MSNDKKVALITGANHGIGFETARQLGQKGITVIVAARSQRAAKEAVDKLIAEGIEAYPVTLDVTKDEDRKAAASFVAENFGKLDILVNNAGITGDGGLLDSRTIETSESELQVVFNTNLFSVIAVTREFLPLLKKSSAGRIVNLSSITGSLTLQAMPGSPIAPLKAFAYNASKTALNQFTVHLAAELKNTNIKVNSAHPGWVKTELGTQHAQLEIVDGAKTSVDLALVGAGGPNGKFIHDGKELPW
ncbi:MAG TPA: SDR family oxidoreductase [Acidobacteriaceae bacterium]|jgi:NAD(P)-dependent dehydrogenase (short-subunit alcohol dehydrogenase family)